MIWDSKLYPNLVSGFNRRYLIPDTSSLTVNVMHYPRQLNEQTTLTKSLRQPIANSRSTNGIGYQSVRAWNRWCQNHLESM